MCAGDDFVHAHDHSDELGWWDGLICYLAYGLMYLGILSILVAQLEGVTVDDGHDHSGEVSEDHRHASVPDHEEHCTR